VDDAVAQGFGDGQRDLVAGAPAGSAGVREADDRLAQRADVLGYRRTLLAQRLILSGRPCGVRT